MKGVLDILHKWCNWNARRYRTFSVDFSGFGNGYNLYVYFIGGSVATYGYYKLQYFPDSRISFEEKKDYSGDGTTIDSISFSHHGFTMYYIKTIVCTGDVKYLKVRDQNGETVLIDER